MERYGPGVAEAGITQAGAALRAAAGPGVRSLSSILVPGDEVVRFRFDALSTAQVTECGTRAGLRCDRVVPAGFPDEPDPGP